MKGAWFGCYLYIYRFWKSGEFLLSFEFNRIDGRGEGWSTNKASVFKVTSVRFGDIRLSRKGCLLRVRMSFSVLLVVSTIGVLVVLSAVVVGGFVGIHIEVF